MIFPQRRAVKAQQFKGGVLAYKRSQFLTSVFFTDVPELIKRIHSFIKKGVVTLIASQNPVKPVVSHFMGYHHVEFKCRARITYHCDVGIFHSPAGYYCTVNCRCMVIWIISEHL